MVSSLVRLADICTDISYGFTASAIEEDTGTKFLRITDIQGGKVDWSTVPFCEIDCKSKTNNLLLENDIVVARTGNSTGENYLFSGESSAVFASYLIRFRVDSSAAHPKFVWYQMRSKEWWNFIGRAKTGSAQAGANAKILGTYELHLPAEADQKAIAHILGSLDDKIELNQKMNQTLEDIAKAIFKSWFVDFDPVRAKAEGRSTGLPPEISALFPDELVDSEIGEIPKGWEILKVKDEAIRQKIGKLYSNKIVEEAGRIPVLDQSDDGIIGYHSNKEFVRASLDCPVFTFANHTCKMRLLFENFSVIQNVIPIKSKSYPVIWFYLRTLGIKQLEEYKGHIPDFMDTQLCFPTVRLAEVLDTLLRPFFHRIYFAKKEIDVLSELRDTLLPKLISGEVRIPNAEKFLEEAGV